MRNLGLKEGGIRINFICCKPCLINGNNYMVGTKIDRSAVLPAAIRPLMSMGYIKPLPASPKQDFTAHEDEGGETPVEHSEAVETPFSERKRGRKRGSGHDADMHLSP